MGTFKKILICAFIGAATMSGSSLAFGGTLSTGAVRITPLTSAATPVPSYHPVTYRTVTTRMTPAGTIEPVIEYPGYCVTSHGISPVIRHEGYIVDANGTVVPLDCSNGQCSLPDASGTGNNSGKTNT